MKLKLSWDDSGHFYESSSGIEIELSDELAIEFRILRHRLWEIETKIENVFAVAEHKRLYPHCDGRRLNATCRYNLQLFHPELFVDSPVAQ